MVVGTPRNMFCGCCCRGLKFPTARPAICFAGAAAVGSSSLRHAPQYVLRVLLPTPTRFGGGMAQAILSPPRRGEAVGKAASALQNYSSPPPLDVKSFLRTNRLFVFWSETYRPKTAKTSRGGNGDYRNCRNSVKIRCRPASTQGGRITLRPMANGQKFADTGAPGALQQHLRLASRKLLMLLRGGRVTGVM